jgi:1,4-dihydroxy-2-naphthoyl-CoA synthase
MREIGENSLCHPTWPNTRLHRREIVSYEQIIYTKDNGVVTITLNRPQVLNAFTVID